MKYIRSIKDMSAHVLVFNDFFHCIEFLKTERTDENTSSFARSLFFLHFNQSSLFVLCDSLSQLLFGILDTLLSDVLNDVKTEKA